MERGQPSLRQTQEQFGRQARRYAESSLHQRGGSLEAIVRVAALRGREWVLDVGSGAGFTAFALAPQAARLVATDLTPQMLAEARRLAQTSGLAPVVEWGLTTAEKLPFADESFDVISCRFATHHFRDLAAAMREFARVIRQEGKVIICDVVAPEAEAMVALMNELEQIRDPTHVWDYPLSQWKDIVAEAGLEIGETVKGKSRQRFREWVERAGTPPEKVSLLLEMFAGASEEARRAFDIRWEGDEVYFAWDNAVICAVKPPH